MRTLMRAFRCACNLSATQTASKAGLCLPELTSLGNGAAVSRSTGSSPSHGRRRIARIARTPLRQRRP